MMVKALVDGYLIFQDTFNRRLEIIKMIKLYLDWHKWV